MADGITYGINFPFRDSRKGDYLALTEFETQQIKADLIHLILTRKGSRYYLPEFGTRIYEFIFEPYDGLTFDAIQSDIRDAVSQFMPQLLLNNITIEPANIDDEVPATTSRSIQDPKMYDIYRVPGKGTAEYTAKVRIDYSITSDVFNSKDFVIINI